MSLVLQSLILSFIAFVTGYILCKYTNPQPKKKEITAKEVLQTLNNKYSTTPKYKADIYQLRTYFTSQNKIYVSLKYDDNIFERAVKSKNKWNEWLECYDLFNSIKIII